ncbi:MAG: MBL fold metallo-hydrolase [candidate division WOR-3 bacterium]|jgi:glyoxylase-like metal-dependent hydrolase (beta-lactamase superfamily II)|nr:MBL fold metallo-hydrolase [candidate division WOR-3 bacterium]MCR4423233.1 MBL fold metallo-hydrolase [candidate division WOR-3 bacterium]MDH7518572.1 MBL fold metallo-hydrolase [bacterium]
MDFGKLKLYPLCDGFFGLDGGAMFGVIPRPLWEKKHPPDERNRIKLALRPLLVATGKELILIDTGIGDKYDSNFAERYRIEKTDSVLSGLARLGFKPEDITTVILTHLHFDHCGGSTQIKDGKLVPTFPRARYIVQQAEWEDAVNPNRRSRASYLGENFLPLKETNLLELINGSIEIYPGIQLLPTGGHTRGMQLVKITSDNKTAIFWSDMIPTQSHIPVPYIMGYDLFPLDSMDQKEKLLNQAVNGNWLSVLEHDREAVMGKITLKDGKYQFEQIKEDKIYEHPKLANEI